MTIKTQAFLQGYMHEKTADEMSDDIDAVQRYLDTIKPVTPIVAAPGIPQAPPDPGVKTLFPGGKARYERTQQQMPTTTLDDKGRETFTPSSVNDQLLQNLKDPEGNPVSAAEFVATQRRNFKKDRPSYLSRLRQGSLGLGRSGDIQVPSIDRGLLDLRRRIADRMADWKKNKDIEKEKVIPTDPKVVPRRDLIDFDARDQPVSLDNPKGVRSEKIPDEFYDVFDEFRKRPQTIPLIRRIFGLDPEKLRKTPEGTPGDTYPPAELRKHVPEWYSEYHGLPDSATKKDMAMLGHEGTHNYTGGQSLSHKFRQNKRDREIAELTKYEYLQDIPDTSHAGRSYITDIGPEYTQAVTAGLNAMRDITGEYLNTPQQVHQLFDEIIAKPSILNSIAPEHARVFRTYLTLRKTNQEAAEKLRESMARDSQYLVESEPAEDPRVQKDVKRV